MLTLRLTITAESDLLIAKQPVMAQESASQPHIPGSMLRGALASSLISGGGKPSAAFRQLFLSPGVVFGDARPVGPGGHTTLPLALSLWSCKRAPGFQAEGGHGVWDLLDGPATMCSECGAPLSRPSGWLSPGRGNGYSIWTPPLRQEAHVELHDRTGQARESVLFTEFRLPRGTRMVAQVRVPKQAGKTGQDFDDTVAALGLAPTGRQAIYLGRGGGRAQVTVFLVPRDDSQPPATPTGDFRLMLISPAIVEDDLGRPLRRFDEQTLAAMLGLSVAQLGVTCVQQFAHSQPVWGWAASHRLPKAMDWALSPGSCARFTINDQAAVEKWWARLLTCGGGYRTSEGFGQVMQLPQLADQGGAQ